MSLYPLYILFPGLDLPLILDKRGASELGAEIKDQEADIGE